MKDRAKRALTWLTLHSGPAIAVIAAVFLGLGVWALAYYFLNPDDQHEWQMFLLLMAGMLSALIGLVIFPIAYIHWTPKWERIEKTTGRIPGMKENE